MPVPPRAERGEMGKFSFQSYLVFMSFYIYHLFCIPEYLTLVYLLCTDVGPVRLADFLRTICWRQKSLLDCSRSKPNAHQFMSRFVYKG
jgi:hypothetical protein